MQTDRRTDGQRARDSPPLPNELQTAMGKEHVYFTEVISDWVAMVVVVVVGVLGNGLTE